MLIRVLLAVDPPPLYERLARLLHQAGALVLPGAVPTDLWENLARESCDLLVATRHAFSTPPVDALTAIRKLPDRPEVVVLQDREDAEDRAALLAAGCLAVISSRLPDTVLQDILRTLIGRRRETLLSGLRRESREAGFRLGDFASSSPRMQEMLALAERVAASDSSLLILGETGVGKEWLARAIHSEGRRATSPFLAVNSAAIPESLIESELFGHERGAFTGALRSRRGSFELAHRGTLFLDEIGDMPPHLQAKLLRVLQERRIQRLGSEDQIPVDVRIMAATHHDLGQAMEAGTFRRDLYYRLGVVTLTVPPLRERRQDIPTLLYSYLERFRNQLGRPVDGIRDDALAALVAYPWPGNVRELINVMERAVLVCPGTEITPEELPQGLGGAAPAAPHPHPQPSPNGGTPLSLPADWLDLPLRVVRSQIATRLERAYLDAQLERTGGRIAETARRAGIGPRALHEKMRTLGLRKEDYR